MPSVRLSYAALNDLIGIDEYSLREWGEAQAERYLSELEACFLKLAQNLRLGRPCKEIGAGLQRIEQGKHVVFFRRRKDGILVSRILHQAMLPRLDRFPED